MGAPQPPLISDRTDNRLWVEWYVWKFVVIKGPPHQETFPILAANSVHRHLYERKPELLERLEHFDKLVAINRLGEIAIHAEIVGSLHVLGRLRTR